MSSIAGDLLVIFEEKLGLVPKTGYLGQQAQQEGVTFFNSLMAKKICKQKCFSVMTQNLNEEFN